MSTNNLVDKQPIQQEKEPEPVQENQQEIADNAGIEMTEMNQQQVIENDEQNEAYENQIHKDLEKQNHFSQHEFGKIDIEFLDHFFEEDPLYYQSLICSRTRPRQFFINQTLFREKQARKVSWDELFLDLLFVGVLSYSAKILKNNAELSWWNVLDFILVFCPIFMAWQTMVMHINRYGRMDILTRIFLYLIMLLVMGMAINCQNAFNPDPSRNTSNLFIGTFLIIRIIYLLMNYLYAYFYAEFAPFIFFVSTVPFLSNIFWLVSCFYTDLNLKRILWGVSYLFDSFFFCLILYFGNRLSRYFRYRLALNIEHYTERIGLFMIVSLGEVVVGIIFSSDNPQFNINYIVTLLGLVVTLCFHSVYFFLLDGHGPRNTHPLRRHSFTGALFSLLHVWLYISIVVGGVGLGLLANGHGADYSLFGIKWYICGGFAFAWLLLTLLAMLFRSNEDDLQDFHSQTSHSGSDLHSTTDFTKSHDSSSASTSTPGKKVLPLSTKRVKSSKLPACYRLNYVNPNQLKPRFPKYARLLTRAMAAVLTVVLGIAFDDTTFYLGNGVYFLICLSVVGILEISLEEFGRMRVLKKEFISPTFTNPSDIEKIIQPQQVKKE